MKRLVLLTFVLLSSISLHAQIKTYRYRDLEFNGYLFTEKQWVVVHNPDTASFYSFGYTYIDPDEGFVFQKTGSFKINKKGKYILNKVEIGKRFEREYIMRRTSWQVPGGRNILGAILPLKHYKELGISMSEPDWVKKYYSYRDTLAYKYKKACVFIEIGCLQCSIPYLEAIYKVDPHYPGVDVRTDNLSGPYFSLKGVELKLGYTYRSLGQFEKSISILNAAILYNPDNISFYMQLGMNYWDKKEQTKGIEIFKQAIALIPDEKSSQKYWFAGCISNMYDELKNDEEKKRWRTLSDSYNPRPGVVY